jgi:ParB-like chromosome segregation protein Spo0J
VHQASPARSVGRSPEGQPRDREGDCVSQAQSDHQDLRYGVAVHPGHALRAVLDPPVEQMPGSGMVVRIPVSSLITGLDVRVDGVDERHVATLAEVTHALPPILVHARSMTVIDGHHRLCAARRNGAVDVDVVLVEGDLMDALVLALRVNSVHGLPLSRKDRRMAVQRILTAYPDWSDRRIASVAGTTHTTVANIRNGATGESGHLNARRGLDGRSRPMDVGERRRRVARLLEERPTGALREIAAAAGVSVGTVRDVRKRQASGLPVAPERSAATGTRVVRPPTAQDLDSVDDLRRPPFSPDRPAGAAKSYADVRELEMLLARLRRDPSFRSTVVGKSLLQGVSIALGLPDLPELLGTVPPHTRSSLRCLARHAAARWHHLADELDAGVEVTG